MSYERGGENEILCGNECQRQMERDRGEREDSKKVHLPLWANLYSVSLT